MGDIGSNAQNIVSFVTGLDIESFCSDVTSFVLGRSIDDDTSILLRFKGGAKGVLNASQVCLGHRNGLMLRVYGDKGALTWRQESPEQLLLSGLDGTDTVLHRGDSAVGDAAAAASRLPGGHPEAFIEAFANIYRGAAAAIAAGRDDADAFGYQSVSDGALSVRFINAVVAAGGQGWTTFQS